MDKRKRNDFGPDDRGGRFDKKSGKPEYRGAAKGRTGTYSKTRDDSSEFTGGVQGGRGPAERKSYGQGKRGGSSDNRGQATGYRGGSSDNRGPATGYRGGSSDNRGPATGYRGGSSDNRGSASGYRGGSSDNRGQATGYRGGSSDNRGSASGYRGGSSDNRGQATGYRGGSSDNRGPASGYRGGSSDNRGSASGYRGGSPDNRGPASGYRGGSSGDRGAAPSFRGTSPERRGFSSEKGGFASDKRGFSPDRREPSIYNHNAKKSAAEEKLPRSNKQEADISGLQEDLDKLEGRNSVLEALKSGRSINRIFVSKGEREGSVTQIIALARQNHILIQEIDRTKLDDMSVTHAHQGVIALAAAKDYVDVETILAKAEESGKPPFIIILDEITDPYNLGSILRTANAAGVHGIIIPKRRAIGLTASVSKASAGAIEYVPVARVTNVVQTIEMLKERNIWVVGTDSTGEKAYFESDLTGPVALVIGSEGEGMGKLVRESCDFVVNIPMLGKISSLNAAVAGAIVSYEIFRQRSTKKS